MDDALRRQWKAAFGSTIGEVGEDILAYWQECCSILKLAVEPVGRERQARADIANDLGMAKEYLFDASRQVD